VNEKRVEKSDVSVRRVFQAQRLAIDGSFNSIVDEWIEHYISVLNFGYACALNTACDFRVAKVSYVEGEWLNYWKDHKDYWQKKTSFEVVEMFRGSQHGFLRLS